MSNRFERTADKKTVERHQKILKDLLQRPENKICADCKKRDPRWASANLGIFICLRCSGIHRSLGVHISKVRSVDLDTWTQEHIDIMQKWGNARANKYWEHSLGPNHVPEESRVESFIRNKYEYKKYCMPGAIPDPDTLDGAQAQQQQPQRSAQQQPQQQPLFSSPPTQPAPVPQQQSGWADFNAFQSAPVPQPQMVQQPVQQQQFNAFPSIAAPPAQAQPQPQPQKAPGIDLKNNIMSLYGSSSQNMQPVQQQFGGFQQPMQSQMGGFSQPTSAYSSANNSFMGPTGFQQQPQQQQQFGSFPMTHGGFQQPQPQQQQMYTVAPSMGLQQQPQQPLFQQQQRPPQSFDAFGSFQQAPLQKQQANPNAGWSAFQ